MTSSAPLVAEPKHIEHEAHDHPEFLAHHFESVQQQFDAGKFGMWLFLITEILFFSGLFCAYAVYRSTHAEAFANADQYLDSTLGATNTAVLILSSLTMAWAVRASQLGQQKLLVRLLTITLACASIFLGVKAVEYSHKWDSGILWASQFHPADHASHSPALLVLSVPAILASVICAIAFGVAKMNGAAVAAPFWKALFVTSVAYFAGVGIGQFVPVLEQSITGASHHSASHAESHGSPSHDASHDRPAAASSGHATSGSHPTEDVDRTYTGIFFSIYFVMTGLHAIHILAGMGVIAWVLWRALRGDFGPNYFGPVDYVGLYWHLVDLIWIYLFPLLYLIG